MELGADLSTDALADALPGRPLRSYPALLSTEADAAAWARAGGPDGAIVVADYQASPRGRAGLPWQVTPGRGLAFSMILRPKLAAEREGWLYTVACTALRDVVGGDAAIAWPDEVRLGAERIAATGVHSELGPDGVRWAVVNVLVVTAEPPRAPLLARVVRALDAHHRAAPADVLAEYLERCETIGRRVRARMIPLGPSGPEVTGTAVSSLEDGALLLETAAGRRVAVRPQNLGLLEPAEAPDAGAAD